VTASREEPEDGASTSSPDPEPPGNTITRLLHAHRRGERDALDRLLPILYQELRAIARGRLGGERAGHTLGPTALVHEAYLKLIGLNRIDWRNRSHFLAMASIVMRRILVDYAVRRKARKRGGDAVRVELDDAHLVADEDLDAVIDLDDALRRLAAEYPRAARILECRYFAGAGNEEIAGMEGCSVATVERDLKFARAWLARDWER